MSTAKRQDAGRPLEVEELKELLPHVAEYGFPTIVIAVSGGPDSMALMAAVSRWSALVQSDLRIIVATVNHGLRPTAQDECAFVAQEADRLGLNCKILRWDGKKPATGIQAKAREARYELLADLCRAENALLLTAHTLDDQAETVMMRLARGSGLRGLQGMNPVRNMTGVLHLRPLLSYPKTRLLATCRAWDIPFVEDPSNQCDDFARVRWRKLMPVLAKEGLDARRIVIFANRLSCADHALTVATTAALKNYKLEETRPEITRIDGRALFENEVAEILWRVFECIIGCDTHLRLHRLEDCVYALRQAALAAKPLRRTLAGVIISLDKNGILTFVPEPPRKRGRRADIC